MTVLGLCKVWCQQERQLPYLGHPTFTDKYYQLYVFEENKKVWFLFDGETTPHLFFDKSKYIHDRSNWRKRIRPCSDTYRYRLAGITD